MIELQPDEIVTGIFRRHWIALFLVVFQIAVGIVLALALPVILELTVPTLREYQPFVFLGALLAAQCLWMVLFFVVADYYLDVWIITNERLIFVELKGLFSRTVSSMSLMNIQEVSSEVHGLLETVFKFGDVRIQSAGPHGSFVFKQVGDPNAVKDLILRAQERGGQRT